jgi:hypothetical protein
MVHMVVYSAGGCVRAMEERWGFGKTRAQLRKEREGKEGSGYDRKAELSHINQEA